MKPAEGEAAAFARVVTSYFGGGSEKRAHTLRNVPGVGAFSAMSARLAPQPVETAPDAQAAPVPPETPPQQQNMAAVPTERPPRVIGVAFDTYVIVQRGQELLLIDQHAAHERILYERLMRSLDQGTGSQQMLVAQVVPVTPQERDRLEQYRAEIEAAGFAFEPFGEDTYQIRAVPVVLGEPQARAAFVEMLDRLGELRVLATRERRREAILQMACKRAVKGGDALTQEEIASLIRQMEETDAPPTCPHGRPLVVRLTRSELEKRFRRINN